MNAALNGPFGRTSLGPTPLTIGRTPDNQLVLDNPKTSSHHAEIRPQGQGYSIVDLGSTNGTFINEQPLERNVPRMLNPGDTIRIGDLTFTYETSGTPGIAPTVYANPSQGSAPGYLPTVAAPPSTAYGKVNAQQSYQQPPPAYPSYTDAGQSSYAPPPPQQPYYVPPQQPYGTPGYPPPPVPSYATPGTMQQKSRRGLWITLGVIGGVLLLFCIACSVFVYAARSTPGKTLTTFCNALKSQDYQTAYDQLSTGLKNQFTESQFAAAFSNNGGSGNVTNCSVSNTSDNGTTGNGTITYTFANGSTAIDDYRLVDESGEWKINNQTTHP